MDGSEISHVFRSFDLASSEGERREEESMLRGLGFRI
jgi:hypothetical protein